MECIEIYWDLKPKVHGVHIAAAYPPEEVSRLLADGVAVDSAYVGNDKYKDLSATVGKGKKAIGYIFYEVPIDAKKIVIDYNAEFWTDGNSIEFIVQE